MKVGSVKPVNLLGGPAVRITYTSNSEPNPVTNKQIRLEHERFIFPKHGAHAFRKFGIATRAASYAA